MLKNNKIPSKFLVTIVLFVFVIISGVYAWKSADNREKIVFKDYLDQVALEVDGQEFTLRDLAFYVAFEENEVQKQAEVYNPEDPIEYWNLHMDGVFVKIACRDGAIQMAIHDEIFYQLALAEDMELNEKERQLMEAAIQDFWEDLSDRDAIEALGVTREEIAKTMERLTLAQKYQIIYAESNNADFEDYAFSTELFKKIKEEHSIKIKEDLWERIDFGYVTVNK